jgi:hypothetical protein
VTHIDEIEDARGGVSNPVGRTLGAPFSDVIAAREKATT